VNKPTPAAQTASRSSFYTGMRILPRAEREAMFEIYSFCRAVDDVADDPGPRDIRREQLAGWRSDIDAVYRGAAPQRLRGLAEAVRRFDLKREDFIAVIDGMEMDVISDIRAPDGATLDLYCDRVACAVGRLSVRVFGMQPEAGLARLYLPREALRAAGIAASDPNAVLAHPAIGQACAAIVALAKTAFHDADTVMAQNPRRVVRAPRIMGVAYRAILGALIARGFAPPREKVRLPRLKLILIVLRNLV
jgi:phytoene synthase